MALTIAGTSVLFAPMVPRAANPGELQIYIVDMEGGQPPLFVTPSGQSVLIETDLRDHKVHC